MGLIVRQKPLNRANAASAGDSTPDAFSFTDVTGATTSTQYTSNTITIAGINTTASYSVSGGTVSKNGGGYSSSSGTCVNGDTFSVRQTSSASNSTQTDVTLTVGGVSDTYSVTTSSGSAALFQDGFESGDFSHTESGWTWGSAAGNVSVSSTRAKTGTKSMLMQYVQSTLGFDNDAEKRLNFSGRPNEVWLHFAWYVPAGWSFQNVPGGSGATNKKWVSIYNNNYNDSDVQCLLQMEYGHTGLNGPDAVADLSITPLNKSGYQSPDNWGSTHGMTIVRTADLGQWMEIIIHFKASSTQNAEDGVVEVWKKANGAGSYTRLCSYTNVAMNANLTANCRFDGIYFMGYANSGHEIGTWDFYVDDVDFYTTNQWGVS
jgi:hypothetical protein